MIDLGKMLFTILAESYEVWPSRRKVLLAPLLAALPLALLERPASAGKIDPSETVVTPADAIKWTSWSDFHHTAARWLRFTAASTSLGPISC